MIFPVHVLGPIPKLSPRLEAVAHPVEGSEFWVSLVVRFEVNLSGARQDVKNNRDLLA